MTRVELLQGMKPVLFNTEMVKAILDGKKTVTRRIIKLPDGMSGHVIKDRLLGFKWKYGIKRPPCYPGDVLYVRESVFQGVGHYLDVSGETVSFLTDDFEYYADGVHKKDHWKDKHENVWMHRRPSIHMPKEAARIFLRVKDVRVERLQDIDDEGAKAEGANCGIGVAEKMREDAIDRFKRIWDSTIKKSDLETYGWDANPWVWVIEFERVYLKV